MRSTLDLLKMKCTFTVLFFDWYEKQIEDNNSKQTIVILFKLFRFNRIRHNTNNGSYNESITVLSHQPKV